MTPVRLCEDSQKGLAPASVSEQPMECFWLPNKKDSLIKLSQSLSSKELPMEYAVELNKLIQLEMEGIA